MAKLLTLALLSALPHTFAYDYYTLLNIGTTCTGVQLGIGGTVNTCATSPLPHMPYSANVTCNTDNTYTASVYANSTTCSATAAHHTITGTQSTCTTASYNQTYGAQSVNVTVSTTTICTPNYSPIGTVTDTSFSPVVTVSTDSACSTSNNVLYYSAGIQNGACQSISLLDASVVLNCASKSASSAWTAQVFMGNKQCNNTVPSLIFSGSGSQCLGSNSGYNGIGYGVAVDCSATTATGSNTNAKIGSASTVGIAGALIASAAAVMVL